MPELDPEVVVGVVVLELGLVVELEVLGLEMLPAALDPWCASQSVFATPVRPTHEVEEPEPELEVLGEVVLLEPELLGDVVLLEPEVLLGELMLPLDPLVLGLAVLGLVALPDEPLPIEPLELPEVCATETPAAPRNAAATAAQRSLLVIFAP
jgi:hypothetical protein